MGLSATSFSIPRAMNAGLVADNDVPGATASRKTTHKISTASGSQAGPSKSPQGPICRHFKRNVVVTLAAQTVPQAVHTSKRRNVLPPSQAAPAPIMPIKKTLDENTALSSSSSSSRSSPTFAIASSSSAPKASANKLQTTLASTSSATPPLPSRSSFTKPLVRSTSRSISQSTTHLEPRVQPKPRTRATPRSSSSLKPRISLSVSTRSMSRLAAMEFGPPAQIRRYSPLAPDNNPGQVESVSKYGSTSAGEPSTSSIVNPTDIHSQPMLQSSKSLPSSSESRAPLDPAVFNPHDQNGVSTYYAHPFPTPSASIPDVETARSSIMASRDINRLDLPVLTPDIDPKSSNGDMDVDGIGMDMDMDVDHDFDCVPVPLTTPETLPVVFAPTPAREILRASRVTPDAYRDNMNDISPPGSPSRNDNSDSDADDEDEDLDRFKAFVPRKPTPPRMRPRPGHPTNSAQRDATRKVTAIEGSSHETIAAQATPPQATAGEFLMNITMSELAVSEDVEMRGDSSPELERGFGRMDVIQPIRGYEEPAAFSVTRNPGTPSVFGVPSTPIRGQRTRSHNVTSQPCTPPPAISQDTSREHASALQTTGARLTAPSPFRAMGGVSRFGVSPRPAISMAPLPWNAPPGGTSFPQAEAVALPSPPEATLPNEHNTTVTETVDIEMPSTHIPINSLPRSSAIGQLSSSESISRKRLSRSSDGDAPAPAQLPARAMLPPSQIPVRVTARPPRRLAAAATSIPGGITATTIPAPSLPLPKGSFAGPHRRPTVSLRGPSRVLPSEPNATVRNSKFTVSTEASDGAPAAKRVRKPSYPSSLGSGPLAQPRDRMVSIPTVKMTPRSVTNPRNFFGSSTTNDENIPPGGMRSVSAPMPNASTSAIALSSSLSSRREGSLSTSATVNRLDSLLGSILQPRKSETPGLSAASASGSASASVLMRSRSSLALQDVTKAPNVASASSGSRASTGSISAGIRGSFDGDLDMATAPQPEAKKENLNPFNYQGIKCLRSVEIYVDVNTEDGSRSSEPWQRHLEQMGAKVYRTLCPSITHILFVRATPATVAWIRRQEDNDRAPHIVSLAWVKACVAAQCQVNEKNYAIDPSTMDIFQQKRKSMEPRALERERFSVGVSSAPVTMTTIKEPARPVLESPESRQRGYQPKTASRLRAFIRATSEDDTE